MTRPNSTEIVAVIDRSGSMAPIRQETISGFNVFVEEQRRVPGEARMTLVQFDDRYELNFSGVPLGDVAPLNAETYVPRGYTALLDAVGKTIKDVGARLSKQLEHERPSRVVFLIVTDGQENHSRKYSYSKVKEMVEHQKSQYSWQFIFLGANIDAFGVADDIGVGRGMSINYFASSRGVWNAYKAASRGMAVSRLSADASADPFAYEASRAAVGDVNLDMSDIAEVVSKVTGK